MDRMTGMSELTNADRLTASTTSWRIMGEIKFLGTAVQVKYESIKLNEKNNTNDIY